MIKKTDKIRCGWCDETSTAEEWNEFSKSQCDTRERRRAYKEIYDEKRFNKNLKQSYYKCPRCERWMQGCQLRVYKENGERYHGLGGEDVFKVVNREMHRD